MLDRFRQKEAQIRETLGDSYLQQHPVMTPQLQQQIDNISANIAKLRGQTPGAAPAAPGAAPAQSAVTKTINGKTYIQQNGQWFEQ